jgi:hypothetical protein
MAATATENTMRILVLALAALCATAPAVAREAPDTDFFEAMAAHDQTFFERGFNQCDFAYLESAVHPQLRFYHDQSGFQDYEAFFRNTRTYLCADPHRKPIRRIDADSLQVFPLHENGVLYAVIHTGSHRFYLREPGKPDVPTGIARFTNVYVLDEGRWLLKEVLSYDHRSVD